MGGRGSSAGGNKYYGKLDDAESNVYNGQDLTKLGNSLGLTDVGIIEREHSLTVDGYITSAYNAGTEARDSTYNKKVASLMEKLGYGDNFGSKMMLADPKENYFLKGTEAATTNDYFFERGDMGYFVARVYK